MDYWDDQLVDLLEFGFPLGFDRSLNLISVEDNHKSAKDYEEHVKHYLQEELDHGATLGPFKSKPINLHVSPIMTRDKPDFQWCWGPKDTYLTRHCVLTQCIPRWDMVEA